MLTLRISPVPARTHCTRGCLCIYPLALSGVARLGYFGGFLVLFIWEGVGGGILVTSIVSNGKGGCVNQGSHNDSKGVNIELPVLPALSLNKLEVCDPTCWYSVPSSKSLMMKRHSSSLEIRNQLSVILISGDPHPLGCQPAVHKLEFRCFTLSEAQGCESFLENFGDKKKYIIFLWPRWRNCSIVFVEIIFSVVIWVVRCGVIHCDNVNTASG